MVQSLDQYMFVHQVVSELTVEREYFLLNDNSTVYEGQKTPKKKKDRKNEE